MMKRLNKITYYLSLNSLRSILLIILTTTILTSCNSVSFVDWLKKPLMLNLSPPPGPPEYQAGYVDGCTSAANESRHNILALHSEGLKKNPILNKTSNIYRSMWRSSYIYCALWIPYLSRNNAAFIRSSFNIQDKARPFTKKYNLIRSAPPGPEPFRIGWKEGCNTGKAATGKTKHKLPYIFVKDPKWIENDNWNPEYQKGWETAFWWCQRFYDIMESPARRPWI